MAIDDLSCNGEYALANDSAGLWMGTVTATYAETGKMLEKYDVEEKAAGQRQRISAAGRVRLDQRRFQRDLGGLSRSYWQRSSNALGRSAVSTHQFRQILFGRARANRVGTPRIGDID